MRFVLLFSFAVCVSLGCTPQEPQNDEYMTRLEDPKRDTEAARQLDAQGRDLIQAGKFEQAEAVLRSALAKDTFYWPAHNDLGIAYYHQKKYYLAAWEFQYAASLAEYDPRPRNNLGLVFEAIRWMPRATESYEQALELAPDNPEYIANLARIHARTGKDPERLRELLSELVFKDTRPDWVNWARERLALMGGPVEPTTRPDSLQPALP